MVSFNMTHKCSIEICPHTQRLTHSHLGVDSTTIVKKCFCIQPVCSVRGGFTQHPGEHSLKLISARNYFKIELRQWRSLQSTALFPSVCSSSGHTGSRMEASWNFRFGIVILGDSAVGKSSLLHRYTEGTFDDSRQSPLGIDFKVHHLDFDPGVVIKMLLWDTAGQERFRWAVVIMLKIILLSESTSCIFIQQASWIDCIDQ